MELEHRCKIVTFDVAALANWWQFKFPVRRQCRQCDATGHYTFGKLSFLGESLGVRQVSGSIVISWRHLAATILPFFLSCPCIMDMQLKLLGACRTGHSGLQCHHLRGKESCHNGWSWAPLISRPTAGSRLRPLLSPLKTWTQVEVERHKISTTPELGLDPMGALQCSSVSGRRDVSWPFTLGKMSLLGESLDVLRLATWE